MVLIRIIGLSMNGIEEMIKDEKFVEKIISPIQILI